MSDLEQLQQQNAKMYDVIIAQSEQIEYFQKVIKEKDEEIKRLNNLISEINK